MSHHRMHSLHRTWRTAGAALAVVGILATAACSGGGSDAGQNGSGSAADASAAVKESKANLAISYKGTDRELPNSSPKPLTDRNIWVISCGQTAEGCAAGARGATEAGKKLGWDVTTVDGKFSPQAWNTGIRQAIADNADGIILDVVDCGPVKTSLDAAKKAGLKIFAWYSFDCNEDGSGEKARFDATLSYGDAYKDAAEFFHAYGRTMADAIIVATDGKAKTIEFRHDELAVVTRLVDGFESRFAECKSCEIVAKQQITLADLGTTLQQKTATLLGRFPQANSIEGMYDSAIALGISAAVVASGRQDAVFVTGGEGFAANKELIKSGKGQDFMAGLPSTWSGWASIDGMNRLLQDEPQVDAGIGFQSIDKDHNLDQMGSSYDGTKDYRSNYAKIWGLS